MKRLEKSVNRPSDIFHVVDHEDIRRVQHGAPEIIVKWSLSEDNLKGSKPRSSRKIN
jgi:hypothetical protein